MILDVSALLSEAVTDDPELFGMMVVAEGRPLFATAEMNQGARMYAHEIGFGSYNRNQRLFFLGPSVAYARHRLWTAVTVLVGLHDVGPRLMPRIAIGIVL